jgi:hypothetical protein
MARSRRDDDYEAAVMALLMSHMYQPISTGFTPASLSDLVLWLDADDADTVTLSGSKVTAWGDKSGNGYSLVQGTDANRPTYETAALNSRNVVRFAGGSSTNLIQSAVSPAQTSTFVAMVLNNTNAWNAAATAECPLSVNSTSVGNGSIDYGATTGTFTNEVATMRSNGTALRGYVSAGGSISAAAHVHMWSFGSNWAFFLDGGADLTTNTSGTPSAMAINRWVVGRRADALLPYTGDMAELIVTATAPSAAARSDLLAYFQSKWGTP